MSLAVKLHPSRYSEVGSESHNLNPLLGLCIMFLLLLSFRSVSFSQSFIDETKQWTVLSTAAMDTNLKLTRCYKFDGDSTINGFSYHKLYSTTNTSITNWMFAFLWWERNDSVFQYCPNCGNLNDSTILMYDFNLAEGDTFTFYNDTIPVDSVRFIEWGGTIRKHWFFNFYSNTITWIEGIGQSGLFCCPLPCLNSMHDELLCFHENGIQLYQHPHYTSCYVSTVNADLLNDHSRSIDIFPNPATDLLYINCEEKATVEIINLQGQVVCTKILSGKNETVDVSGIENGVYLVRVKTQEFIITNRLIIQ